MALNKHLLQGILVILISIFVLSCTDDEEELPSAGELSGYWSSRSLIVVDCDPETLNGRKVQCSMACVVLEISNDHDYDLRGGLFFGQTELGDLEINDDIISFCPFSENEKREIRFKKTENGMNLWFEERGCQFKADMKLHEF